MKRGPVKNDDTFSDKAENDADTSELGIYVIIFLQPHLLLALVDIFTITFLLNIADVKSNKRQKSQHFASQG